LIVADRPKRRRLRRAQVWGIVDSWLPEGLEGADAVRREVALRLASELDSAPPAYAVARISSALLDAVSQIERNTESPSELDLRSLLREVVGNRS
jgi:hypothetical protein